MSRMFKTVDGKPMKTWNPFSGCLYFCYNGGCWARLTALRLKHLDRYKDGFAPRYNEKELLKTFLPGQFIAVSLMGDIAFATKDQLLMILRRIRDFPHTYFLIQSKNPDYFRGWQISGVHFPPHVYLGTTIETNRNYGLTKAPAPIQRFRALTSCPHNLKFLSIEPIMDFDLDELTHWVKLMQPDIIEVGADNYHNHLPEPPWWKVEKLLETLRNTPNFLGAYPKVIEKDGLERLKGGKDDHE